RTATLNHGFQSIVEQILWLVMQFYTDKQERLITGRDGKARTVNLRAEHLMGEKRGGGTIPAPPYAVQVQVQRRNPMRVQAQNETILQAYQMAAQAGQMIPLSQLYQMLTIDGADRIIPLLQQSEQTQQQMQEMAQQNEALAQQVDSLKQALDTSTKAVQDNMYGNQALG
ncbi:MAG: hypothetical protein PHY12_12310, partial [Eubacteriales bacterium]|nr:hypothetical protein [Eubacteriales bacterium]